MVMGVSFDSWVSISFMSNSEGINGVSTLITKQEELRDLAREAWIPLKGPLPPYISGMKRVPGIDLEYPDIMRSLMPKFASFFT
jgi:hypothetical protein